jgi:hypothetical protein
LNAVIVVGDEQVDSVRRRIGWKILGRIALVSTAAVKRARQPRNRYRLAVPFDPAVKYGRDPMAVARVCGEPCGKEKEAGDGWDAAVTLAPANTRGAGEL